MKPLRAPLTDERRVELTDYLELLNRRIAAHDTAVARVEQLAEKRSELEREIPLLSAEIDPLQPAESLRRLAELKTQLELVTHAQPGARRAVEEALQTLKGMAQYSSAEQLKPILEAEYDAVLAAAAIAIAPFCEGELSAQHKARALPIVSNAGGRRGCHWANTASPETAWRIRDWITAILDAQNPFED